MAIIPRFSKYVFPNRSLCDVPVIGQAFEINPVLATAIIISKMTIAIMGTTVPGTTTEDGKMP